MEFKTAHPTISAAILGEIHHDDDDEIVPAMDTQALADIVAEHRANDGLWFKPETPMEASLQSELRRLHAAVDDCKPATTGDKDVY